MSDQDVGLIPAQKVTRFNVNGATIDAGTSILTSNLISRRAPSIFRIMISMAIAGKFKAQLTRNAITIDVTFNNNVNLAANSLYTFDMLMAREDSVNFEQDQDNQTINIITVLEIPSAI